MHVPTSLKHTSNIIICATLALMFASIVLMAKTLPLHSNGSYEIFDNEGHHTESGSYTGSLRTHAGEQTSIRISQTIQLGLVHPTRYTVMADDCLESLHINGGKIPGTPFCDYARGEELELGTLLRTGLNAITAVVKNDGGQTSFIFTPSRFDMLALLAQLTWFFSCATVAGLLLNSALKNRASMNIWHVFAVAILIRFAYVLSTNHTVRGYDTDGHIDYVLHIVDQWSIPIGADGWQFYQPPLYYLAGGAWISITSALGADKDTVPLLLQMLSLAFSCCTIAVSGWILQLFFPKKAQQSLMTLCFGIFALFPGSVFLASRINNDVLLELIGLVAWGLLCAWWLSKNNHYWYGSIIALGLSLLTKSNALLLLPVFAACLIYKPGLPFKKRATLGFIALGILVMLNGWYIGLRALEGQDGIVANLGNLHSGLLLKTDWVNMVEFNPVRAAVQPYNNPWEDNSGRQYFWEYLFRSAFTGEFSFGSRLAPLVTTMIALGFLLFVVSIIGGWHVILERPLELLPLWLMPLCLLMGHAMYKQFIAPYSSSQDFRYSILAVLPLAILTVQGLSYVPWAKTRWAQIIAWSFVTNCAIFLCSVGIA